jgi:hypothetical protein
LNTGGIKISTPLFAPQRPEGPKSRFHECIQSFDIPSQVFVPVFMDHPQFSEHDWQRGCQQLFSMIKAMWSMDYLKFALSAVTMTKNHIKKRSSHSIKEHPGCRESILHLVDFPSGKKLLTERVLQHG